MEITKGSPNFTIQCGAASGVTNPGDASVALLESAMGIDLITDAAIYLNGAVGTPYANNAGGSVAVNEGVDGFLNAIVVAWGINLSAHISDIMWAKMA